MKVIVETPGLSAGRAVSIILMKLQKLILSETVCIAACHYLKYRNI